MSDCRIQVSLAAGPGPTLPPRRVLTVIGLRSGRCLRATDDLEHLRSRVDAARRRTIARPELMRVDVVQSGRHVPAYIDPWQVESIEPIGVAAP